LARLDAEVADARASHVEKQQRCAEALCRRFRQALVDIGLDDLQDWTEPEDGVVSFGDLENRDAEKFVGILEGVAAKARRGW